MLCVVRRRCSGIRPKLRKFFSRAICPLQDVTKLRTDSGFRISRTSSRQTGFSTGRYFWRNQILLVNLNQKVPHVESERTMGMCCSSLSRGRRASLAVPEEDPRRDGAHTMSPPDGARAPSSSVPAQDVETIIVDSSLSAAAVGPVEPAGEVVSSPYLPLDPTRDILLFSRAAVLGTGGYATVFCCVPRVKRAQQPSDNPSDLSAPGVVAKATPVPTRKTYVALKEVQKSRVDWNPRAVANLWRERDCHFLLCGPDKHVMYYSMGTELVVDRSCGQRVGGGRCQRVGGDSGCPPRSPLVGEQNKRHRRTGIGARGCSPDEVIALWFPETVRVDSSCCLSLS